MRDMTALKSPWSNVVGTGSDLTKHLAVGSNTTRVARWLVKRHSYDPSSRVTHEKARQRKDSAHTSSHSAKIRAGREISVVKLALVLLLHRPEPNIENVGSASDKVNRDFPTTCEEEGGASLLLTCQREQGPSMPPDQS